MRVHVLKLLVGLFLAGCHSPTFLLLLSMAPTVVLAQSSSARLAGRVASQADGKPVAGALVTYRNRETNAADYRSTNAQGLYSFPVLPPGHYEVRADKVGLRPGLRPDIELTAGARVEVNFELEAAAAAVPSVPSTWAPKSGIAVMAVKVVLVGRVTNGATGQPIAKALVTLRNVQTNSADHRFTNEQGLYAFASVAPGRYEMRTDAVGSQPELYSPLFIGTSSPVEINFALKAAGPVITKCEAPLTEADLTKLIRGGVHESRLRELIGSCDVGFELSSALEQRLRSAGATEGVLQALRSRQPASSAQQLEFAAKDAEDFAKFIKSPRGRGFPESNVKVLLNQDATLSSLKVYLGAWLPRSAKPNDIVYIFIATHGMVEKGAEKAAYLMTYDSDPDDLFHTALPMSDLGDIIGTRLAKAGRIVLFTDACHAGKMSEQSKGINRQIEQAASKNTEMIGIMASRPTEFSQEGKQFCGGHGAFTCFLLKGMDGAADADKDKTVTVTELIQYLQDQVPKATNNEQHPREFGNFDREVPLAFVDKRGPALSFPAASSPSGVPQQPAGSGERNLWALVVGISQFKNLRSDRGLPTLPTVARRFP